MSLREGSNREIRRVMDALLLPVTRLIRVAYGPFQLGNLPRGEAEEVNGKILREQVPGLGSKCRGRCPRTPAKGRALRSAVLNHEPGS